MSTESPQPSSKLPSKPSNSGITTPGHCPSAAHGWLRTRWLFGSRKWRKSEILLQTEGAVPPICGVHQIWRLFPGWSLHIGIYTGSKIKYSPQWSSLEERFSSFFHCYFNFPFAESSEFSPGIANLLLLMMSLFSPNTQKSSVKLQGFVDAGRYHQIPAKKKKKNTGDKKMRIF